MSQETEPIDSAVKRLHHRRTFRHERRTMTLVLLVRDADWRPLDAPWWHGKEVCLIGVDTDGNFFLRHCDGSVRYWDHHLGKDIVVAASVREFVQRIE